MMISQSDMVIRAQFYDLLARLFRLEVDTALLENLKSLSFPETEQEPLAEGYRMIQNWLGTCDESAVEDLAVDYAKVFLAAGSNDGSAAIPCESVYTSPKKLVMQEAWESVCTAYRAFGLAKDPACSDLMEDHLALELEFMSTLVRQGTIEEQKQFLEQHLLNWLPDFTADIDKYAEQDFYKALGRITLGFIQSEQQLLQGLADGTLKQASSFSVRQERMANVFARLQENYRLFAPVRFPKRGPKGTDLIRYGEISTLDQIVNDAKSHFSPKEIFYPISQTMFHFTEDTCTTHELADEKDIIIFARPCDINAIHRLDNIFLNNGESDFFYRRMREKIHFFMLECRESFDNCFCVSMGANMTEDYSAAFRIDDICALVEIRDEAFLPYFAEEVSIDFTPEFVSSNPRAAKLPVIEDRKTLEAVCKAEYWNMYDNVCISCGGCNTVCPTCSCFDTVDVIYDETSRDGERRRVWSSCMLQDFTRTAGGGMARKTPGANMRFKVLHKVYDYNKRFGGAEHMCVGCGRCIDRCPKSIDYLGAINGLTESLEKGEI